MKKRRILLGLFMAAGAALSLTSCVKQEPSNGGTQQVTTFDVTFNTNGGSDVAKQTVESGKKVTKPADPTKTATKTTAYTFAGWFKDAALTQSFNFETETITAATTLYAKWTETAVAADKFTVKFLNGTTELTALKQEVNENGKVTKPARTSLPTQEGKRFDYWSADGGVTPYNFDDVVISDLELSAVFVDANDFDTLAASANKVVAVDFYDDAVASATAVSFASETIALSSTNAENRITNDNKFNLAKDTLAIDLGNKKITAATTGVLTVYFETSFQAIKNGEAFFQLDGSSANKENTEVFGLRVTSGDNKGKIGYRLDGGDDVASEVTVELNKTYKIKLVFDLSDGKASYFVDGAAAAENVVININAVRGLKFTSKSDESSKKTVDNIVATFEAKAKSELATAKEAAIAALDAKTLSTDNAIKAAEEAVIAETKTTINAATTIEAVNTAKEAAIAYVDATKYTLTVKAYTAANTAATGTTDVVKVYKTTDTVSLTDVAFAGFTVDKFYTDATLATEYTPAALTANIEVFAKVNNASKVTLTLDLTDISNVKKQDATAADWSTNGDLREDQQDGTPAKEPTASDYIEPTITKNAVQLTLKASDNKDQYLQTPTFADATKSVTINMQGFTAGSGNASKYVKITAYNAAGTAIGSVDAYTPTGKLNGNFTTAATDGSADIVITTNEDIAYLKFTCQTDAKSYYINQLTVTYEK